MNFVLNAAGNDSTKIKEEGTTNKLHLVGDFDGGPDEMEPCLEMESLETQSPALLLILLRIIDSLRPLGFVTGKLLLLVATSGSPLPALCSA